MKTLRKRIDSKSRELSRFFLRTGEATFGILCTVPVTSLQKDIIEMEKVQQRAERTARGFKDLRYSEWYSLAKKRLSGNSLKYRQF